MSGRWEEVVRIRFRGLRFQDHALDLSALTELSQFQRIVAETAKALWRAAHPDRERLPAHFEERMRLCLRRIEDGSAVAPLEVFVEEAQSSLFGPDVSELSEVNDAIDLATRVFRSAENDAPLPDGVPRVLLPEYGRWGLDLRDDESIEIQVPAGNAVAKVTRESRNRLAAFVEESYEAPVDLVGEVLEADVRQRRFQLWSDDRTPVTTSFPPELEDHVTAALREHRTTRVRVRGRAEFSPSGKPIRIVSIESWQVVPIDESIDNSARPVEDVLRQLANEIPSDEWKKVPRDLSSNLDHYLYGTPKR